MSKFGWSLPAGCGQLPGEEETDIAISDICPQITTGIELKWD
jgi:hypothetical protein